MSAGAVVRVFDACVSEGLIVRPFGDRIILSPPLIRDHSPFDQMSDILRKDMLFKSELLRA